MIDIQIATSYINKANNARSNGHEFTLTFSQYRRILLRKRCYFTGVKLTSTPKQGETAKPTSFTLDRIDNSIGYVHGNVVPACRAVNQLKSTIENSTSVLTFTNLYKSIDKFKHHGLK